jgi:hypothetical protein
VRQLADDTFMIAGELTMRGVTRAIELVSDEVSLQLDLSAVKNQPEEAPRLRDETLGHAA